jgi:SOS-response transcriptional repressor LexA
MSWAEVNKPMAVPERVKTVMAMISRAAENGRAAPTNGEIADAIGAKSVSAGVNIVSLLETMGMIRVERYGAGRLITVTATGKATRYEGTRRQHWRERGIKPAPPKARIAAPPPEPQPVECLTRVDRGPCPRCGVRADFGCRHGHIPFGLSSFA